MEPTTYSTSQTTSQPKKTWKRWAELNGSFRETKYFFTENLVYIGDYMVTAPITLAEYIKFKDAAKAWAYRKNKRIKTTAYKAETPGMYRVKIMLIAHHRKREYEF